ncbi:MAG: transglutaminase-like domain-containing protein [Oscillospiraceae bacterium]|nr:transglutaminase-like domain-containing protein [Oscillospiraceae bacterium]
MNIKKLAAALITAVILLTAPCFIADFTDKVVFPALTVSAESSQFSLSPTYTDLGGAVAVCYNTISSKYKARLYYYLNGEKRYAVPQTEGFIYLNGLTPGSKYTCILKYTNGKKSYRYKFTIKLKKSADSVISLEKYGSEHVMLSWKDIADDYFYALYRYESGKWKKLGITSGTHYIDGGLKPNTRYKYKLKVIGNDGMINIPETVFFANTKPSAVKSKGVDPASQSMYWVGPEGANGYYIYRSVNDKYVRIARLSAGKTSFDLSDYSDETFGVSAYRRNSDGTVSESSITSVNYHRPPDYPQNINGKYSSDGNIVLSWDSAWDNAKYAVYMSDDVNGKYSLVLTTSSTSCTIEGKKDFSPRYFRIMYISGSYKSDYSPIYIVVRTVKKTTVKASCLQKSSSWASDKICSVPKNSTVDVIAIQNNFYFCIYNGKYGYLYDLALDNKTEHIARSALNPANLDIFIDDWIFYNGKGTKAIWEYVNKFPYNSARADNRITSAKTLRKYTNELAVNMIKYNSGICYHYAALSGKILERAGYNTYLVYCPHTKSGFHCYNKIKLNGTLTYFDACRHTYNNKLGYLPDSSTYISARKLDIDKEEIVELC